MASWAPDAGWILLRSFNSYAHPAARPSALYHLPDAPTVGTDEHGVARIAVQGGSAYLKIADGCRRPCAFCSIPLIKGTTVSRPAGKYSGRGTPTGRPWHQRIIAHRPGYNRLRP